MKIRPFFIFYRETWLLGPVASLTQGEFRIGLGLVFGEIGISFDFQHNYGFGCHGCGALQWEENKQLPPGWDKIYRTDSTYYFRCPACIEKGYRDDEPDAD